MSQEDPQKEERISRTPKCMSRKQNWKGRKAEDNGEGHESRYYDVMNERREKEMDSAFKPRKERHRTLMALRQYYNYVDKRIEINETLMKDDILSAFTYYQITSNTLGNPPLRP